MDLVGSIYVKFQTISQVNNKYYNSFFKYMLYCNNCNKEAVIYGINYNSDGELQIELLRKKIEEEGKLILFNPPPFEKHKCPNCFNLLDEIKTKESAK